MGLLDNFPHRCKIQRRIRSKDTLGSGKDTVTVEQTGVHCWEQQASDSEVRDYEKRGMRVSRKVFFLTDPLVTERHQIVITKRNGVAIAAANQIALDVKSEPVPDASAGLGVVYRVMVDDLTGSRD